MDYEKDRQRRIRNVTASCFSWISCGGVPRDTDLTEFGLPKNEWRGIKGAARHILARKREGANGEARAMAKEFAGELAGRLIKTDFEPPADSPLPYTSDPRELADRVYRNQGRGGF